MEYPFVKKLAVESLPFPHPSLRATFTPEGEGKIQLLN
jgi:hypothetical protein